MRKKRMILVLIVVAVAVAFTFFSPYKCIERHVTRNQSNLTLASEFYLEQGEVNKAGNDRVDAGGIYGDVNKIVQYSWWAFGIAPSSTHYGFYYSPNDVPVPYCGVDCELKETSSGEWSYIDDYSNSGKIKKITDQWYYYEIRF